MPSRSPNCSAGGISKRGDAMSDHGLLPMRRVSGRFFRIMLADRVATVLDGPTAYHAGRYHSPGQKALYMSSSVEWASVAMSTYVHDDARPRLAVPLYVENALCVDLREGGLADALGFDPALANNPWRPPIVRGERPPSWDVSDAVRAAGANGLVDPSRFRLGGWHLVLFSWNLAGGASVRRDGAVCAPVHIPRPDLAGRRP